MRKKPKFKPVPTKAIRDLPGELRTHILSFVNQTPFYPKPFSIKSPIEYKGSDFMHVRAPPRAPKKAWRKTAHGEVTFGKRSAEGELITYEYDKKRKR